MSKVFITGVGMVSAIGMNTGQCLDSLLHSRTGIEPIQYLGTNHRGKIPAGEVKATNAALAEMLKLQDARSFGRTAMMGVMAAREACQQAGIITGDGWKTGLVSATSVGGIDLSEIFFKNYLEHPGSTEGYHMVFSHDCGDSTERIADDLKIRDYVTTISTACSSSANAMLLGARLIKSGILDRVVVGGTDALTIYTLNGFNSLLILDDQWCRPFDQDRKGLNLGEGAAYLVLESEKAVKATKKEPLCELAGYGNANDAYHQTASSPDGKGALKAMEIAMEIGGLKPEQIDYINAHGTATPNNDLSEGTAIKRLFHDYLPKFSSTKSFTGHTLAAAGAIEAVISVMALQHHFLAPNLNFGKPIDELGLVPVLELEKEVAVKRILSNSFGFGGNCSAMIFSSC